MNMFFTTQRRLRQALLLVPLLGALTAGAQSNIAPAAKVTHHDERQPGGGVGLRGAHNYNDGFIGDYPGTFTGNVNFRGFIEFEWPNEQSFNRVVAYKGAVAFENAALEYWDGSAWQRITDFRSSVPEADSVTFPVVKTTKLRMTDVGSATREPADFREIVIRQAPDRACGGTPLAGTVWPASQDRCYGDEALLIAGDYSYDAGFQWQVNDGSGWVDISGATQSWYRFRATRATPANASYRLGATCNGSNYEYSAPVDVRVTGGNDAVYAALPYFEGFETNPWLDFCGTGDVPSESWTSNNVAGAYKWAANNSRNSKWGPFLAPLQGQFAARFWSYFNGDAPPYTANLDVHVDCSAQPGAHRAEFFFVNPPGQQPTPGNDFMLVLVSTDGGQNFIPVGGWEDEPNWSKKVVLFNSGSANTIIRFKGYSQSIPGMREASDIGLDSVFVKGVDPCAGNPGTPVVTPGGPLQLCAGTSTMLSASNIDQVPGISLQWQQSLTGGAPWTNATGGSGASTPEYYTPVLYDTVWYRLQVNCTTQGSTGSANSATVVIRAPAPIYASIPFVESFEEWTKRCNSNGNDVPSLSWINTPYQGKNSWRRNDQGDVEWGDVGSGSSAFPSAIYAQYPDPAFHGEHSARFHTYGSRGKSGSLDLFIDCSTHPGDKLLSLALNLTRDVPQHPNSNQPPPTDYDYMIVYLSVDGGASFTQLERFDGPAFSKWEIKSINIPSTSAKTVIRFEAHGVTGFRDMGLDYIRVMPACDGRPDAGVIVTEEPCADKDFFLRLDGASQAGGLVYQWQRSVNGSTWINMPGTGSDVYTTQINAKTWFRTIVTCANSGLVDTTPVHIVELAPFYLCYCESGFDATRSLNQGTMDIPSCGPKVGNITITTPAIDTVLSHGDYKNHYYYPRVDFEKKPSNFTQTVPPAQLYLDSSYNFTIHGIFQSTGSKPTKWAAYIDFNHDGIYDTLTERIWIDLNADTDDRPNPTPGSPFYTYQFWVPSNAKVGLTGMRVIVMTGNCLSIQDGNAGPIPCAKFAGGETVDYLVEIKYAECTGAPNAGTAVVSHDKHCPGYTVTLTNATHEAQRSNIGWDWQSSPNGATWTTIANSAGLDTVDYVLTGDVQFRLRIWCGNTNDTGYSNIATVTMKEPYQCYCYSEATGKSLDSSDVGVLTINDETFGAPGGHLNNAAAIHGRTDNTDQTINLLANEPLELSLTHILRSSRHADAKVTVFIDYNNNLQYDIPEERVWSTTTTASAWNLSETITIPSGVVTNVPTGLRVIINNDTDPNVPSDEACGPYVSGETEDYVVAFIEGTHTNIAQQQHGINRLHVYPNPATGKVFLQYFGALQEKATVSVLSMAGQVLQSQDLSQVANHSIIELNLEGLANGVYYVRFATASGYVNEKLTLLGR